MSKPTFTTEKRMETLLIDSRGMLKTLNIRGLTLEQVEADLIKCG